MLDILEGFLLNPAYCLLKTSGSTKSAVMALEIASPLGSKAGPLRTSEGELSIAHCTRPGCEALLPDKHGTAAAHCSNSTAATAKHSWCGLLLIDLVSCWEGILHHEE